MKNLLLTISAIILLTACYKTEPDLKNPVAVNLLYPFENSLCNVGTDSTVTEGTIVFEWTAGLYATEYEFNLKNLATGDSISQLTSQTKLSLRILRSAPYSWFVVSKSDINSNTAKSKIWKFYNAGEAIENYAPFPAEIVSPKMAQTIVASSNTISLSWTGSDIDDDIIGYDVYFGTTNTPPLIETNFQDTTLNNVAISAGTVYYWKIITKDTRGNTSDSGIYQFRVK
ncbi:MAG: hypothetical protein WCX31_06680 [Salinivirgaceae bacterium]